MPNHVKIVPKEMELLGVIRIVNGLGQNASIKKVTEMIILINIFTSTLAKLVGELVILRICLEKRKDVPGIKVISQKQNFGLKKITPGLVATLVLRSRLNASKIKNVSFFQ